MSKCTFYNLTSLCVLSTFPLKYPSQGCEGFPNRKLLTAAIVHLRPRKSELATIGPLLISTWFLTRYNVTDVPVKELKYLCEIVLKVRMK